MLDSSMEAPSNSREKSLPAPLTRLCTSGSRRVPFDYFARSDSLLPATRDPSIVQTLVEDEFHFDKFLQDKWDRAAEHGIQRRNTGVVFKVALPCLPLIIPLTLRRTSGLSV